MDEIAEMAAPYYDNNVRGGEAHMEVGKLKKEEVKEKPKTFADVKNRLIIC